MCSRYFCIDDPAPQHEWQGHDGVFKQLIEWMEGSLLHGIEHFLLYNFDGWQGFTCRGHLQKVFGRLFGNQGALLIRRIPPRNIKRLFVSGQKSCAVVAYQHRCWRVHCLFTAWDEILQTLQVHSLSLQRIRFARAVANKIEILEILSVLRVPAVDGHDKDYPWLSRTHRTRWPRRVSIHGVEVFDEGCPLTLSHGSGEVNSSSVTRPSWGFGTWRNVSEPQLGRVQKAVEVFVLHSVLIQHCQQPQTAMNIRRLWSQGSNGHQALAFGPPTKEVLGQCTFSCLCAAPILQQFVYHYRKEVGVCFSLHGDVVRCGDAQAAAYCMLIASVLCVMVEGLLGTFLYLFVHCRRLWRGVGSSPELTTLPCNVAKLIDNDFCNMHKTDTQLKGCEAAAQESAAALTRIGMQ